MMRVRECVDMLRTSHGPWAARIRHEVYYLHQHRMPRLRALGALLRDLVTVARLSAADNPMPGATCLALVTLDGSSGGGTIARALPAKPPGQQALCILGPAAAPLADWPGRHLSRPRFAEIGRAWAREWRWLTRPAAAPLSTLVVCCVMLRHLLWRAVWQSSFAQQLQARILLLHNDFDMLASSALAAAPASLRIVCLQHGIPSDEFFPTQAPEQIVWGETSRAVYREQGCESVLRCHSFGRNILPPSSAEVPAGIALISQTHTPVFGLALGPYFTQAATELAAHTDRGFTILLHPRERADHPYDQALQPYLRQPPHPILQQCEHAQLILGYASTALLDAARAGHYVATFTWPVMASLGAHAVAQPPCRVNSVREALALYENLRNDATARAQHLATQAAWLTATFSEGDATWL